MKFIIEVTMTGTRTYDVEAADEALATAEASRRAATDFKADENRLSLLSTHLRCPKCKKALWRECNFCNICGTPRPGKEVTENGNTIQQ